MPATKRPNLQLNLHYYRFDLDQPEQAQAWADLILELKEQGYQCHIDDRSRVQSFDASNHKFWEMVRKVTGPIEVEPDHLFDNQMNTAPIEGVTESGLRLWDWIMVRYPNPKIIDGYYVGPRAELQKLRETVRRCGYCGSHYWPGEADEQKFCNRCLDSTYLKTELLPLLRLRPVAEMSKDAPPITQDELAELMPRYREAQLRGGTERALALTMRYRDNAAKAYTKAVADATAEFVGMTWLLDHGVPPENFIFYKHIGRWAAGWRQKLDDSIAKDLVASLRGFPFPVDVHGDSGVLVYEPEQPYVDTMSHLTPLLMRQALDRIHEILDGEEWSADTAQDVSDVLTDIGYEVADFEGGDDE